MTACCPMRRIPRYGTPEDLKSLIDAAHGLGLMVFLDVVYNHFGPEGNYLHAYAAALLRQASTRPGAPRSTSARRRCATTSSRTRCYWIEEYRFDGLRFDAVHAIADAGLAGSDRRPHPPRRSRTGRSIWCWKTSTTGPPPAARSATSTRNGTTISTTSCTPLLTGERDGYYEDFAEAGARSWRRALARGASCSRARSPAIAARRAASPRRTCRRPPSCCSCRTTTRSAIAPSAIA